MSTRACYTFKDATDKFTVYVHHDGYPTGAAEYFAATLASGKVWTLPRYEADEFAAGFVASVKDCGGGVRLVKSPRAVADIAYLYTVTQKDGVLMIRADTVDNWDTWKVKKFFDGPLSVFIEKAGTFE